MNSFVHYNHRYFYSINYQEIDANGYCAYEYILNYETYWKIYGNLPWFLRRYEEEIYGQNSSYFTTIAKEIILLDRLTD